MTYPTSVAGAEQPISPYRSSGLRARIAELLLAISTVLAGATLVGAAAGLWYLDRLTTGDASQAEFEALLAFNTMTSLVALVVSVATAVAYLAWLSRAVDNVPALGGGRPPASPRWAIAWWFIPFANLGMPYEVVRDVRARMRSDPQLSHPPLLVAWWFTFIIGEVLATAALQVAAETLAQAGAILMVVVVSQALTLCAGVLAILVVREIEAASRRRAARVQAGEPMWAGGLAGDADLVANGQTGWRMRPSWVGFVAITLSFILGVAVSAWAGSVEGAPLVAASATSSPDGSENPTAQGSLDPSASPGSSLDPSTCRDQSVLPHEAPELEPLLPTTIDGREMTTWSMSGSCWLEIAFSTDDVLSDFVAIADEFDVDVDDLRMSVTGRSNTESDPPYFAYVLSIPDSPDAYDLALFLHLGMIVGPEDVETFISGMSAETTLLGGKDVFVDESDLVPQNEHQRGRMYWYPTKSHDFFVLTDDQAWAEDALRQLP